MLLNQLTESLCVGTCGVLSQCGIINNDDLVCTASDQILCEVFDAGAQKDSDDLFLVVSLQVLGLCNQLKNGGFDDAVFLLGKHPYALVIFLCHECSPP